MVLVIDNYDSFTYNLVQYLRETARVKVVRNDRISLGKIESMQPQHIVISPGPGRPESAGISEELIKHFQGRIPILGVCLGHQCIGQVYGGKITEAEQIFHGKTSEIYLTKTQKTHKNKLFQGIKTPFTATRYHSLIVSPEQFPEQLEVMAETNSGEIMALSHKNYHIYGVQFHPESILTQIGKNLLNNFIKIGR